MKVVLAGGTGFVGTALGAALAAAGEEVVVLTRDPARAPPIALGVRLEAWDPSQVGGWVAHLRGADAVVNLCGEGVADGRWTEARKARLRASRVDLTRILVQALDAADPAPPVLVNASAVGYYGTREEGEVTEAAPPGDDFLARLCVDWEAAAMEAVGRGVRVVLPRFGVVLGPGGGALPRLQRAFRWYLGGPVGSGRQHFPWLHLDDAAGIVRFALARADLRGPLNAVAPERVTMRALAEAMGRVMRRPSWLPVPAFAVRGLLGEGADALLTGQAAVPERLESLGYSFRFPRLEPALRDLVG